MVPNVFVYVIVVLMEETWVCLKANAKDLVTKKRLYIRAREGLFSYCWENRRKWNPSIGRGPGHGKKEGHPLIVSSQKEEGLKHWKCECLCV